MIIMKLLKFNVYLKNKISYVLDLFIFYIYGCSYPCMSAQTVHYLVPAEELTGHSKTGVMNNHCVGI